ncbi:hypothetical protein PUMCH_002094 [Australozyma saopauloensis]|uniref:4-hydroxyphenylpyruvate dioxygenase n=1 Tax=Australozyma saopauloensis TaxID=291208 RepID=A0AAX4H8A7_9ASCO|nr:hypothetical protein PUMCH_002094 [[Candida] saopauloensis]
MLWLKELPFFAWDLNFPEDKHSKFHSHYSSNAEDGIQSFFAVRLATSNAKEMAAYLCHIFGFTEIATRDLENGNICVCSHVLRKDDVVFEVVGTLETRSDTSYTKAKDKFQISHPPEGNFIDLETKILNFLGGSEDLRQNVHEALQYNGIRKLIDELGKLNQPVVLSAIEEASMASKINEFVSLHGIGVIDVAFEVKNVRNLYSKAISAGATIINPPKLSRDLNGGVLIATVGSPISDIHHTLVEFLDYNGPYLPSYAPAKSHTVEDREFVLQGIDHCVQNYHFGELIPSTNFYMSAFGLHKFWSVDDKDISTSNSGLRSIVISNLNEKVLLPFNEPVESKMRGQIEEFYDYYGGPGIQHIALRTNNIIAMVRSLKSQGLEFNTISDEYYEALKQKLTLLKIELYEDFEELKSHHILADVDQSSLYHLQDGKLRSNYILQIFSKPIHDRPTLFFEIIQRYNHNGFGKGTFKGLYESIEEQQKLRGTLTPTELGRSHQIPQEFRELESI